MRLDRVALLALVAAALCGGCQAPDVGQRCNFGWAAAPSVPAPTPSTIDADYLETGNMACDSLVCIVSPATSGEYASCDGDQCGYCSKPCVSDTDCYKSETGLVCRQMVLDADYIQWLQENHPELAATYLGDAPYSRYCAVPLQ